ncbi:hypothetical protein BKA67DRAFT_678230 [Truncatella angustata]|uniref:FAD-binding PCMH-type domain-containing protein n=1 Tax=Truncatella angustata TaxID=152316 RepID=A0A9P8ZXJ7_9PEZI|nr:uncharacterized protein BKA67DRAFT_678230 [Truncatella angustata]KAH6653118.1 hypothetical protein BKA67DRAFT_678230 [Truncatella angustata]
MGSNWPVETCLEILFPLATGASVPYYFHHTPVTRRDLSVEQVQKELGSVLSNSTLIFGPSSSQYPNATDRYSTYAVPDIQIIVRPGKESDVSSIVQYANQNSIDFLAVNRGHDLNAWAGTLSGMQIDMTALTNVTIQPDGQTALLQGGTYDGEVTKYLYDNGYVATTGACDCVGLLGAGLGGGHGRWEGFYGLVSDNFVSFNLVLANGTEIKVNNESHNDLFWAMKGAGHNLGIVTSFELKIHPNPVESWYYKFYRFSGDKLEIVFKELNKLHNNGTIPVEMASNYGGFWWDTTVSDTEASIYWVFAYAGPAADAEELLQPFNDIGFASAENGTLPYPNISDVSGTGLDGPLCAHNQSHIVATAGLQVYNITAERQILDLFNAKVAQYPGLKGGHVVHEGYSIKAVRDVDPASTAFPLRDDYLLMFFDTTIAEGSNLTEPTKKWAAEVRDLWNAGQPGRKPSTYVNYGLGDESLESTYGYEAWRLEKLRSLKSQYDPDNRFRFYMPIVPNGMSPRV